MAAVDERKNRAGVQSRSSMGAPAVQYPPLPQLVPPPRSEMGTVAPRRAAMLAPPAAAPQGFDRRGMGQQPLPTPRSTAPAADFTGPGISAPTALAGLPLLTRGVTQPTAPAQPQRETPEQQVARLTATPPGLVAGPPVYSTGNARSGTMTSSRGTQTVPSDYGAGRTNTFSSAALPTYQSVAQTQQVRANYPRSYAPDATAGRSREMDAAVAELVSRVQKPLMSYDDLFQRRGALAALTAMSGLAQGAGSNAVTAAGQQLEADTRTRGQDIDERLGIMRDFTDRRGQDLGYGAQTRGQDLTYDAAMSGQNVAREEGMLSRIFGLRKAKLAAKSAQAVALEEARTRMAEMYLKYPTAEVERMVATGQGPKGEVLPPETRTQLAQQLRESRAGKMSALDALLAQQLPASPAGR